MSTKMFLLFRISVVCTFLGLFLRDTFFWHLLPVTTIINIYFIYKEYRSYVKAPKKYSSTPYQRRVVCAANKLNEALILSIRHFDTQMCEAIIVRTKLYPDEVWKNSEQGFVDQHGVFLTRKEAWVVAVKANQITCLVGCQSADDLKKSDVELFSENLYL